MTLSTDERDTLLDLLVSGSFRLVGTSFIGEGHAAYFASTVLSLQSRGLVRITWGSPVMAYPVEEAARAAVRGGAA